MFLKGCNCIEDYETKVQRARAIVDNLISYDNELLPVNGGQLSDRRIHARIVQLMQTQPFSLDHRPVGYLEHRHASIPHVPFEIYECED